MEEPRRAAETGALIKRNRCLCNRLYGRDAGRCRRRLSKATATSSRRFRHATRLSRLESTVSSRAFTHHYCCTSWTLVAPIDLSQESHESAYPLRVPTSPVFSFFGSEDSDVETRHRFCSLVYKSEDELEEMKTRRSDHGRLKQHRINTTHS